MTIPDFDTLEEAVRSSFPVDATRIVGVREHGDNALALFDTRPGAEPYLYQVHYWRTNGRWTEGNSGNGYGWHRYTLESDLGVATVWGDDAPAGADRVRGECEGDIREDKIDNGTYLLVWWDVPEDAATAELKSFRVNGDWVLAPTMEERMDAIRTHLRSRGLL
jgi:hypothetical protein